MIENSITQPFMRSMPYGTPVEKPTKKKGFNLKAHKKKEQLCKCNKQGCSL